jgi:DNA-binding CsgD family transcriptional regulator
MAQRKKPAAIAEQLVIEVSTVNTHKKHIYRKLDIHSSKELQQLF